MIDMNLTGAFHTIQPILPDMVAGKWGRIVTISSQTAQSGSQDRAHYAAPKGGVIGLTRSLARELVPHLQSTPSRRLWSTRLWRRRACDPDRCRRWK